jgi:hypothetical protein
MTVERSNMTPTAWVSLGSAIVSLLALAVTTNTARIAAQERRLRREGAFAEEVYVVLRSLRDAAFGYAVREYGEHDADLLLVARSAMELQGLLPGVVDDSLLTQLQQLLATTAVQYALDQYKVTSVSARTLSPTGMHREFKRAAQLADSAIKRCQELRRAQA